ncbi:MAG: TIGR04222 domain-containing membrane protein [Acidobacteriota bacterium]|nr:TIGR04222 domain-containing membrane protein [Acidobacteriota bacterium]
MDILLDNPLASMYGPYFLVLYGFVILFTLIFLGFAKTGIDKTNNLPLPPIPAEIDPYQIAYLRGGINEVARSAIFSLMQKGYAELKIEEKSSAIKRIYNRSDENLSEIEKLSLKWIGQSRDVGEVFQANGLITQIESYGLTYQNRLEREQMLIGDNLRNSFSIWKWSAFAVIFGFGFYKFLAAYAYGQTNVAFLVIFAAVGLVITYYSSKMPRVSKLGKAYLERLQLAFDSLKYQSQAGYIQNGERRGVHQTTFAGVDPLLLSVGIFGSGILVGTVFDNYNQAFQRSQQQSAASSCGSGCGSSCSSGDGGGGCGGCGGGD